MTHPRDHILPLAWQARSDMTTLANVTCKVRVNGGSATTYTNVSTPAITQYADITYGYELKIPASTYTDGDVVEVTWLYSATAYAVDNIIIGLAEVDGAYYTTARGTKLDYLDSAISGIATAVWAAATRTLTSISDSSGVTTLLSRLTSTRASNLDYLDASISSVKSHTDLIGSAVITVTGPVLQNGALVALVQGDDYRTTDGRNLSWTSTSWAITGATISMVVRNPTDATSTTTFTGTVTSATAASVELTAAQTAALSVGMGAYTLSATLSNGHVSTLVQGNLSVAKAS